jgi:hypothetical protein
VSVKPQHPPPAEVACLLARDHFWKDEQQRLIGTHPDWPDAAYLLGLGDELAHALVLVLSRLPPAQRPDFADVFYAERKGRRADSLPDNPRVRLALAAEVVLKVVGVLDVETLDARTLDFLRGAAQLDDLTTAPAPAVAALQRTIGRIRLNVEFGTRATRSGRLRLRSPRSSIRPATSSTSKKSSRDVHGPPSKLGSRRLCSASCSTSSGSLPTHTPDRYQPHARR